ncbi:MAG: 4Fe-4S ferredoxin [Spirochaetes bacterium]|nr:MAG: 4Fe-4S ferredoxin [Spirochaetota bacterium]
MITVDPHRCPQNHPCPMVKRCPHAAITQQGYLAPAISREHCASCGVCVQSCPYKAFVNLGEM